MQHSQVVERFEEGLPSLGLQGGGKGEELLEEQDQFLPPALLSVFVGQLVEEFGQELFVFLELRHDFVLVEKDERRQCGEHVFLEYGRSWEDHFLNVLHPEIRKHSFLQKLT